MIVFQDNIRLSLDIFTLLSENGFGEVLLTTSKGVYLQFSSGILLLTDLDSGITPIGLGLSKFVHFLTVIKPERNQPVRFTDGRFYFPGGILEPQWKIVQLNKVTYSVLPDRVIDAGKQLQAWSAGSRGVASLVGPLLLDQPMNQNETVNQYCIAAEPVLRELTEFQSCDIDAAVGRLIGLGLGLTPSLDDVMLGLMYGLIRLAPQEPQTASVRKAILKHAPTRTNAISGAYLYAVAQGRPFERLDDILSGLAGTIPLDIAPILQIGSSSGSEMLLGLLLAAKMIMKG